MYVWIFNGELFSSVAVILGKWSEIGTGLLRGLVLNGLCPAFGIWGGNTSYLISWVNTFAVFVCFGVAATHLPLGGVSVRVLVCGIFHLRTSTRSLIARMLSSTWILSLPQIPKNHKYFKPLLWRLEIFGDRREIIKSATETKWKRNRGIRVYFEEKDILMLFAIKETDKLC